jgi:hypothetical protein
MAARLQDGWIIVDCEAPLSSHVQVKVGNDMPVPAFRGEGVAMARPRITMGGKPRVQLLVDGLITYSGPLEQA